MCCLRYEVEAYQDFSKRAPKKGATVRTPKGDGEVVELDALHETVKLRFSCGGDAKPETLKVPLDLMRCALGNKCKGHGFEGTCCNHVEDASNCPRPCEITKRSFAELEARDGADDLFAPLPIAFKGRSATGKVVAAQGDDTQTSAPPSPARKERKRGKGRRPRPNKEQNTPASDAARPKPKEEKQPQAQKRKRKPNKDRNTGARRAAIVSKGDTGTESTVRQTKRVPRRRAQ
jgi:hypothetical protein